MKAKAAWWALCLSATLGLVYTARADLLVLSDGRVIDGKIESVADREIVFHLDGSPADAAPQHVDRRSVTRLVYCDEDGAVVPAPTASTNPSAPATPARWTVPPEPTAPPIVEPEAGKSTYYVIPLHGEAGVTVLASALEKSLADAVARKPSVVILDIDSPGGLVDESIKIIKVISHYNKKCKIVAYTEQDLSAAAIFTLSCQQIYVKQLSTIGAATSFVPGQPGLSAKVEEKMQSAWRAAARNSAEEGHHDPLLADAMIDNDTELHIETVDGKPVIKEGAGEHMLVRKGKVLTLTSHEAVACGLAAGEADDLDELGKELDCPSWVECKGVSRDLADYLPKRDQALEAVMKKIGGDVAAHVQAAAESDPTGNQEFIEVVQQQAVPGPVRPGPGPNFPRPGFPRYPVPGRGFAPMVPQNQVITRRVVAKTEPRNWKPQSLRCVANLQLVEADLADALAALHDFGHGTESSPIKDLQTKIGIARQAMYKDRNKFAGQVAAAPTVPQPPAQPKSRQLAELSAEPGASAPQPAEADARLKQIATGWQDPKASGTPLAGKVIGLSATRCSDETLHISAGGVVASPEYYEPTVTFRAVVMSSGKQTRINCGGSSIFFNSTMHPDELRLYSGPANAQHKQGAGTLPKDQWVGLEFSITPQELVIYVDGAERYRFAGDYSKIHQQFAIRADNGDIWVKSIEVIQPK